jgi:hypothetical protein
MVREGLSPAPGASGQRGKESPTPYPPKTEEKTAVGRRRGSRLIPLLGLVAVILAMVALVVVFALTA